MLGTGTRSLLTVGAACALLVACSSQDGDGESPTSVSAESDSESGDGVESGEVEADAAPIDAIAFNGTPGEPLDMAAYFTGSIRRGVVDNDNATAVAGFEALDGDLDGVEELMELLKETPSCADNIALDLWAGDAAAPASIEALESPWEITTSGEEPVAYTIPMNLICAATDGGEVDHWVIVGFAQTSSPGPLNQLGGWGVDSFSLET